MTDTPETIESTDRERRLGRRAMLKGVAAGVVGTAAAGTASAHENTVVLDADERPVTYRIEVAGSIEKGDEAGQTDAIVDDGVAVGRMVRTDDLDDVRDGYRFTGQMRRLDVTEGSLKRVRVNGEAVDPDDLAGSSPATALLEDFEDGAWPDDWVDETEGYEITDDALTDEFSVEADGSPGYPDVRKPTAATPRGHTYTIQVLPGSREVSPTLLTNCQERNVLNDSYAAWLRTGEDALRLQVRSDGDGTTLEEVSTDESVEPGDAYVIALDVGLDRVRARAFAGDGEQIATTDWYDDTTHTGGTLGLYTDGEGEQVVGTRYDQCVQWLLGTS